MIEDFFIKNNNSQIYMSAALSRFLGSPDGIVFLSSKDGDEIAITTPDRLKNIDNDDVVRTTFRDDSRALRLAGVPKYIMKKVNGRMNATKVEDGVVTFKVGERSDG